MDDAMQMMGKILIVDDEARNIAMLEEILEDFTLEKASSGASALEKLSGFAPDIILLDIMMPDLNGYEVCRRIRRLPESRFTKVIFVSGKAFLKDRLVGYEAGGDDYLVKPFEGDELLAKVRVFLRLKHAEEMNQLKSQFLDLISHETRTPLTGILSSVEILLADPALRFEEVGGLLDSIQSSGRRLLGFLEKTVLLCSLKCRDRVDASEQAFDAILEPVLEDLRVAAAKAGVSVRKEILAPTVVCDPVLLARSLGYVLENAVRFSPRGSVVEVKGWRDDSDGGWMMTVSDQGKGVEPDLREAIFGEFAILDVGHHTEGQGLSLAIARRILALHGGTLRCAASETGGATFVFRLPPG